MDTIEKDFLQLVAKLNLINQNKHVMMITANRYTEICMI